MKIAVLNIVLALALSALLMNGGASNSNSVGSLDEIIKCSEEVDRDCKFLFEWNESQSIRDHDRRCPSSEACRCGVYSFPDVRSLKTKLFADSGHAVPTRTQIEIKDSNTVVGLGNFASTFKVKSTANTKILASAFSINPSESIMVGTTGWLTASYDFLERVRVAAASQSERPGPAVVTDRDSES